MALLVERSDPPRPGPLTVLHFVWSVLWGTLWTALLAPGVIVHSAFRPGARTLKPWMRVWGRLVLAGAGIGLRVEDRARLAPGQPVVFVANHQNALDVVTAAVGVPYPFGYTAKAGLRRLPFVGAVLAHTACVFVDRSTPRRAAQTLIEAGGRIREGDPVLVFAEGERSWSATLRPLMRGAFLLAVEAGVPIVPVVLRGNVGVLDERRWASRPGAVRVVVAEPIPTAGLTRADVPALMEQVRGVLERTLR
ncbi:MAG TPA: lysophospholipid acyltransferase family protein [Rubricoccaceae bacterium]|nr:lysophospholipid acyltransferase family protein [Rubricoccaceae bacterium]